MDDRDLKAKILYYCREKYYHAMQTMSLDGVRKFPTDASFKLYNGLSLVLEKKVQEGIRELSPLQTDTDVVLGAVLALMTAHRKCASVDKEALIILDSKLKDSRKHASESALLYAAIILFHVDKVDKAREYVDKLLKTNPNSADGLAIKGWVELYLGKDSKMNDIANFFDSAIENSPAKRNMDAIFGKVRYLEMQKKYDDAIGHLNQLVVRYPSFSPPLIEKMKNQLALMDIDQAIETANRILSGDPHCVEALKVKVLIVICRDGNYEEGALSLRRFFTELETNEPKNAELFAENAKLFSRICGRNHSILSETYRFAEKAAQLDSSCPELLTELGYQCLLQGRVKEATRFYRNASKMDDSSVVALSGLTQCQLSEGGNIDQARQQVEFLREVQGSQPSPDLLLMSTQLVSGDMNQALKYLNQAVDTHFQTLQDHPFGTVYLRKLDPDFLLQIVKEYMVYAPIQSSTDASLNTTQTRQLPEPLRRSLLVLEAVTKACPGLLEGLYQLARVKFLSGDTRSAAVTLQHILDDVDATCPDAHLLMAQIHIQLKRYQKAAQSLEVGLSYNFKVREHPLYHLITALIQKEEGKISDCIQTLKTAMSLAGLKPGSASHVRTMTGTMQQLALPDKTSLYLELVEAYKASNQMHEATKIMQDAIDTFQGTPEEGRVTVANANLSLSRGDVSISLELLQSIKPGQAYYIQARHKMADIHLNHRKDRRAYAECFRELVLNAPGPQSLVMLGDAYMAVQEPERAIEAYEKALQQNPQDSSLACKIGKALIKTHQYGKAINYYREAVKNEAGGELKLDMAELYMKLRQYDKAEKTLMQELDSKNDTSDISGLITRSKVLLMLAEVREKAGNIKASLETLKEAQDNQSRVLKRSALEFGGGNDVQMKIAGEICQKMAELANSLRDYSSSIKWYKEALTYIPDDASTLVALSRLHMQVNDLEQCQSTCMALQKADADNDAATVMLADLAFRKVDFETAVFHFQQLLSRRPNYWTALARLIEVMRRTGRLEEVPPYLEKAEAASQRASQEAGLCYCKALYKWYSGNPNSALSQFNGARQDSEWGQQAIYNMIEICLSYDNDTIDMSEDNEGSREIGIRTAEHLLNELQPRSIGGSDEALNHRLLGNFLLLATRQKPNIERALQDFAAVASQDLYRDHVGAALGLATGYMLLKQTPRARNQLKRVAKNLWNFEDAEYLERCWLLLADIYIQSGKYDLASELLKRVLQHNKGCTKAYEYLGLVSEKEQAYREASTHYERAWHYGGRTNSTIGYKLAYNYMKAKRYADAIDVCHQILKEQPDYPRIRKEILEKSRNNLRT
uniref:Tetratricopeptide repeat protein 21B n=1 Tax=Timema bartmani TaxID=61472 RepID=A0A7R9HYI2_9NEOP|nr:unnamed protein product [Timema bartmani]